MNDASAHSFSSHELPRGVNLITIVVSKDLCKLIMLTEVPLSRTQHQKLDYFQQHFSFLSAAEVSMYECRSLSIIPQVALPVSVSVRVPVAFIGTSRNPDIEKIGRTRMILLTLSCLSEWFRSRQQ